MDAKSSSSHLGLSLLFVILGYLCNLQATAILLSNLDIDTFGDFSCAWRALSLFAQIMLIGSFYTRYHYDNRTITPKFILSHRPLVARSIVSAVTVYCLFWLFTLHAHEGDFSQLPSYHLVYFASIFATLQTCVVVLERFISTLGFSLYTHFSSDLLHYLVKLLVIGVGFQLYHPSSTPELTGFIAAFLILIALCDVLSIKALTYNSGTNLPTGTFSNSRPNPGIYPFTWHNLRQDPAAAGIVATLSTTAPVYLIEIFSPHEHLVGLYSLCMILISFIEPLLLRSSEETHTTLLNSPAHATAAQKKQLENKLSNISAIRLGLIIATYFFYILFHEQIFSPFIHYDFHDPKLVALMLLALYLGDVANQRETFLHSHNQTALCLGVNCLALCLIIFLGILLTEPYSLMGVLCASVISQLVRAMLFSYLYRKHSNLRFSLLW